MPEDGEFSENANAASVGSFEDFRGFFVQRFSHLRGEQSNDQIKSSSFLVKRQ